ncbi:ABC-type Fe3+/spermidine/putrescine transport system ATPase subunit [Winogradskyella wandonensis]|uniref:ABC-type Fe3+/spermidine/putrescine transport system ATPase subunit n=1 Tax=Winogradskyella wandonensis TaxID=1442586 RepID=A0A4R1KTN5_9FLAO|nr:ABC transporter ATP-binding protein [Winogradskyella wandonensis]TCK67897.1 ABC-type Fe3+/spermidine/putrescine transport system ATPase subunit [Winogradskyella wandonensis]
MLQVKHITFGYDKTLVLDNISFNLEKGKNLAIIGKSGSGKSTLLKLIYGEYDVDQGDIFWKDTQILGPKHNLVIGYEFMKYVAQEFDLMPFITVEENIGKYLSRFYHEEKQKRTTELIKVVELEAFAKTKIKNLSGGQKQRVALARALAKQPEILLLDEPFSHIDNFKKQSLRRRVFSYLKENNIACIVATHDNNDVLGFADEMLVLDQKKIIAKDTPQNLYNNPKLPLIASFFGEFNVIDGKIYYAHKLRIVDEDSLRDTSATKKGIVKASYFNGDFWLVEVDCDSNTIFIYHKTPIEPETQIFFSFQK